MKEPNPALLKALEFIQVKLSENRNKSSESSIVSHFTLAQREELGGILYKIETLTQSRAKKEFTVEEMEEQIQYLVGEDFMGGIRKQAQEKAAELVYDKLYAQLDAIVVLSSMDKKEKPEEPQEVTSSITSSPKGSTRPAQLSRGDSFLDKKKESCIGEINF
jgi:hypothetical protein